MSARKTRILARSMRQHLERKMRSVSPSVRRAFKVFCVPARAERYLQLIDAETPKAHKKLTGLLAHGFERSPFRPEYETVHPNSSDARAAVLNIAQRLGLSGDCDVLSENRELDGTRLTFTDLFDTTDASGFGTFAVLDPERLAFFQGEDARTTTVLHKP